MVSATPSPLSETLAAPLGFGMAVYLAIGFLVAGYVAFRGMKLRRPPSNGLLWEKKDNARNGLFLFQSIAILCLPIFVLELALWPLVLLYLWAYQDDGDDQTI